MSEIKCASDYDKKTAPGYTIKYDRRHLRNKPGWTVWWRKDAHTILPLKAAWTKSQANRESWNFWSMTPAKWEKETGIYL